MAAPFFVTNGITFDRAKPPTPGKAGNELGMVPPVLSQFDLSISPENGGYIEAKLLEKGWEDGYVQNWNLHLQHLLGKSTSIQIGYLGNKMTHYPTQYYTNIARPGPGNQQAKRPWPRLASGDWFHSYGSGTYHSVQTEVEQRFTQGLSFRAGYTFGKSINDIRMSQDEFARHEAKARADWDRTQVFFFSGVYELPFGKQMKGLAQNILSGWQLSTIVSLQSGGVFHPAVSADIANMGTRRTLLPNRVGDGNLPEDERTLERYFDTSAFQLQGAYLYGNSGYNVLVSDGIANVDMGAAKRWAWSESQELQLRVEMFNLFNHPTFGRPNATVDSGGFGRITSAGTARQIQFGLRYGF